jgi:hypothetical protein
MKIDFGDLSGKSVKKLSLKSDKNVGALCMKTKISFIVSGDTNSPQ